VEYVVSMASPLSGPWDFTTVLLVNSELVSLIQRLFLTSGPHISFFDKGRFITEKF
jgi:hypothetical protein